MSFFFSFFSSVVTPASPTTTLICCESAGFLHLPLQYGIAANQPCRSVCCRASMQQQQQHNSSSNVPFVASYCCVPVSVCVSECVCNPTSTKTSRVELQLWLTEGQGDAAQQSEQPMISSLAQAGERTGSSSMAVECCCSPSYMQLFSQW